MILRAVPENPAADSHEGTLFQRFAGEADRRAKKAGLAPVWRSAHC
jgi:hypothetical protein